MKERGAVEWTVGKLMSIVLLVVVLALVVYGVSSGGLIPLFERAGGMFDEVLLFFGNWGGGRGEDMECLEPIKINIEGVGVGVLMRCREYCEVSMEKSVGYFGSGVFRLEGDEISSVNDGTKYSQNDKIADVEVVRVYREVYFELKDELNSIFNGGDVELASVMEFDPENVLEIKIISRNNLIYRWDEANWVGAGGAHDTKLSRYKFIPMLYDNYYSKSYDILWGYRGGAEMMIGEGMDVVRFYKWIGDLINDWDSKFLVYSEGIDKIKKSEIDIGGKRYSLNVGKRYIVGIHYNAFIYVDLDDDKVGIYYVDGKAHFYSEKYAGKYDYLVTVSDSLWGEIVKLNKIYEFLKSKC